VARLQVTTSGNRMVRLHVEELLKEREMNPLELSRLAGIPVTTAYRLARPDAPRRIDLGTIDRVCAALHVAPGELFVYVRDQPRAKRRRRRRR